MFNLEKDKVYRSKVTGTLHRCVDVREGGRLGWFVQLNNDCTVLLTYKKHPLKCGFMANRHLISSTSCEEVELNEMNNIFCKPCRVNVMYMDSQANGYMIWRCI